MKFGAPGELLWLLFIPVLAFLMWNGNRLARKRLHKLLSPDLLPRLVDLPVNWLRMVRQACLLLASTLFVLTLARPQWGVTQETVAFRGRDILIAIDTSRSMLAGDVSPSRLGRAKLVAEDLIAALPEERIGLIAFAGEADVQAPLTVDHDTVIDTINHLDTNTIARGGTDIAAAIRAAELALGQKSKSLRALVLLTDGEELDEDGVEAARKAAQSGIRIFTIGIGSPNGSQVALPNGQVLRDRDGEVVISKLDEARLRSIAESTGGFYVRLTSTTASQVLTQGLLHLGDANLTNRSLTKPIERYQWPLAFGLLFLFLAMVTADRPRRAAVPLRKSTALLLFSFALLSVSRGASALDFYRSGDYEAALDLWQDELKTHPHDPLVNLNAGNAAYRLDRFDQAFENYSEAMNSPNSTLRENAYYNGGNSLFKAGDNQEDVERQLMNYYDAKYLYEQALDIDPNDAAAKKNLDLLLRRIKEAEQQKQMEQQRQNSRGNGGQQQKNGAQNQQDSGKSGQRQNQHNQGNSQSDENNDGQSESPNSTPKNKKGDLREIQPRDPNRPDNQDSQSTQDEKMSREEANGLLDSLRGEEDHVNLSKHKREKPVTRDW
ncbi:MAG: VWA domain-containing protein [Verrucomicrobia bacterium]|nr:VWA domain-containing protein [Verrucomicrobiota bacterium]